MAVSLLALQWSDLGFGIALAVALAILFLVPYLIYEIRRGKGELGPLRRLINRRRRQMRSDSCDKPVSRTLDLTPIGVPHDKTPRKTVAGRTVD